MLKLAIVTIATAAVLLAGIWTAETSQNLRTDIYEPKTLAMMDQAFATIWSVVRADDPFRDYANDSELRLAIGQQLLDLVADGVTDPSRLRYLTLGSLVLPRR